MENDRLDLVLKVLARPQRRTVVRYLVDEYLPIPLPSFTTYLALSLFPDADSDSFEAFRTRIHTRLHHVHLPMLDEAGIVDYDPNLADGVIEKGPEFETAVELVDAT